MIQQNFQVINNWLFELNKYITFHNYKVIVDTIWEVSGVVMFICMIGLLALAFSFACAHLKKFVKAIATCGIAFGVSTFLFILSFFTEIYFQDKLIPITDHNQPVVQKATNNLNHLYNKVVRIDTNQQIYLYFTSNTNKINSIKTLSTDNASVSLNSDNKGVLVRMNYDSTAGHLESYQLIKSPITLSNSDDNSIEIFNTKNVSISHILLDSDDYFCQR